MAEFAVRHAYLVLFALTLLEALGLPIPAVQILLVVVMLAVTPYLARWLGHRFGGGTVPPD